jgi:5-methylcytosine-specific restriction endonuclease McrA
MRNRREYPDNWNDEIRPKILQRDQYKCTDCGIRHRQWVAKRLREKIIKIESNEKEDYRGFGYKVYMIRLHVCHINNNKKDTREVNLKSLCVSCHAKMDSNYKALIRKGNMIKKQITILDVINEIEGASKSQDKLV